MAARLAFALVGLLLWFHPSAFAQGDILGSNRAQPSTASPGAQPDVRVRRVPDRPYVPDPDADLRWVQLLGDDLVYRLDTDLGEPVHRDLDSVPTVVCAAPPCDVWLPPDVRLAVQVRGASYARGRIWVPPGHGILQADVTRPRRRWAAGGLIIGSTMIAGVGLFVAGSNEDPDSFLSFRDVFFGLGAAILLAGLVTGLILFALPRRARARWRRVERAGAWH
ncbi:MAG: hypothetical protein JJ863_22900 [Deltaproteobacteria bacterium]|nr:hypothetical protein [Deltaproteobacteria bacterium]